MDIYKNSLFKDWAQKNNILDDALILAVNEMNQGLYEAGLGGGVYKKRIPIGNRGKVVGLVQSLLLL